MLIRLMIGIVQPLPTPGIWSLAFSSPMSFSWVIPLRHLSLGLSRMIVSNMETGEGSVEVSARPTFPRTCSTSGVSLMILSWMVMSRFASLIEMLGRVTGMKSRLPSFRGGMNSLPMRVTMTIAIENRAAAIATVFFRLSSAQLSAGLYAFIRYFIVQLSSSLCSLPRTRNEHRTGTSVTAMKVDPTIANVLVKARGWNIFPSRPVRAKTGTNARMMIAMA